MNRSVKAPLIIGGLVVLVSAPFGASVVMLLGDAPRELPAWREAWATAIFGLFLLSVPTYLACLVSAIVLKRSEKHLVAWRCSWLSFLPPFAACLLLALYFAVPGPK